MPGKSPYVVESQTASNKGVYSGGRLSGPISKNRQGSGKTPYNFSFLYTLLLTV